MSAAEGSASGEPASDAADHAGQQLTDAAALAVEREAAQEALLVREAKRAQLREEFDAALQRAEVKAQYEAKLGQLIAAVEVELIAALADAAPPPPPPRPPPPAYVTEEELSAKFAELERGDLEAQLKRELRSRGRLD